MCDVYADQEFNAFHHYPSGNKPASFSNVYIPQSNEWYTAYCLSSVCQETKTSKNFICGFNNKTYTMKIRNIMLIDLTSMYGSNSLVPTSIERIKLDCAAIGHNLNTYQPYTPIKEVR